LVEQGLEQMEVALVDERHLDRRALERPRGAEPPEPAADDDHSVVLGHLTRLADVAEQDASQR
jgi:hypothetical protein